MGKRDLSEKLLMSYNDVFAEIWNNLGCDEIGHIDPSDLIDAPTESVFVTDDDVPYNMIRDISKIYGNGVLQIAVLCIENQTNVDDMMPLRVMLYNAMTYWSRHRNDKIMLPALTRVFYFGYKERWKGPRRLSEMMKIAPELKKEFEKYGDYAINVIEVAWLSQKERARLKGDFREIAEMLRAGRLGRDIRGSQRLLDHPRALCSLLNSVLGVELQMEEKDFERGVSMENILSRNNEKFLNRGMKLGEERGMKLGEERGMKLGEERTSEAIVRQLHTMNMSDEFISEATRLPIAKVREILSKS